MKTKLNKIISVLIVSAMLMSSFAFTAGADTVYSYVSENVYSDGGTTAPSLGTAGTNTRAFAPDTSNAQTGTVAQAGETYSGYGRTDGNSFYRWEEPAMNTNLMAWTHGGVKETAHDQVGEFNYRLHNGARLSLQDNAPGGNLRRIDGADNYWHHLVYAYNYAKGEITVWVDGKLYGMYTSSSKANGLYLRARLEGDVTGTAIEIDDINAYALDEASSAIVTTAEDGTTVSSYDSYNYIVNEKAQLEPVLKAGEIIRSVNISSDTATLNSIKVDETYGTCADVIDEAMYSGNSDVTSARIFSEDFSTEYTEGEDAQGKILVIEGENSLGNTVVETYSIDSTYTYEAEIRSDGGTTAPSLGTGGTRTRAFAPDTSNAQTGFVAQAGEAYNGYGKKAGDSFYRWEAPAKNTNLMAWTHSGDIGAAHDQVGEFNYRLHNGARLSLQANGPTAHLIRIDGVDNNWHHLVYAYNYAQKRMIVWVDGEKYNEYTNASYIPNGLYLRAYLDGDCSGTAIEIDDIRAWALDPASSGKVTYKEDGATVEAYNSYEKIVNDYADYYMPEVTAAGVLQSVSEGKIKVDKSVSSAEVIAAALANDGIISAEVYNADFTESYSGEEAAQGNILAVTGMNAAGSEIISCYELVDIYSYYDVITATGAADDYFGTVDSNARALDRDYAIVTVGENGVTGSGKADGDSFYRFTEESYDVALQTPEDGKAAASNLMAWAYSDSTATLHDQTGSLSFRLSKDAIPFQVYSNGGSYDSLIGTEKYLDNQWHKLAYAYNAAKQEMAFWIDGELIKSVNTISYGIYLRLYQAKTESDYRVLTGDAYIDFDDITAYTLDNASSGITSTDGEGNTVYDSYDSLVSKHLNVSLPDEITGNESVVVTDGEIAAVTDITAADVLALTEDTAYIYDSELLEIQGDTAVLADGMYLVISSGVDFRYYKIGKYKAMGKLWLKDVYSNTVNYVCEIVNPQSEELTVVAYTKNTDTSTVYAKNRVVFSAGQKKTIGLGAVTESNLIFYLWNEAMAPYCAPISLPE